MTGTLCCYALLVTLLFAAGCGMQGTFAGNVWGQTILSMVDIEARSVQEDIGDLLRSWELDYNRVISELLIVILSVILVIVLVVLIAGRLT